MTNRNWLIRLVLVLMIIVISIVVFQMKKDNETERADDLTVLISRLKNSNSDGFERIQIRNEFSTPEIVTATPEQLNSILQFFKNNDFKIEEYNKPRTKSNPSEFELWLTFKGYNGEESLYFYRDSLIFKNYRATIVDRQKLIDFIETITNQ